MITELLKHYSWELRKEAGLVPRLYKSIAYYEEPDAKPKYLVSVIGQVY